MKGKIYLCFGKILRNINPKKSGWYQCTVAFISDGNKYQTYVMDLYYYNEINRWKDNRRQNIFDSYEVLGYGEGNERKRLYTSYLCDRTDEVVAWKKIPKPYKRKGILYYE